MNCCIQSGGERYCKGAREGGALQLVARSLQRKHLRIAMMIAFFFLSIHQVAANIQEQPITISVKNASLETVFAEIRKQTGINFIYTKDLLQRTVKVSIDVHNESLQRVMELIMKDQPLSYTLLDEYVVIKKKQPPSTPMLSPDKEVHGKVTNQKGEAVMGATVGVKDSRNITFTDEGGVFILRNVIAGAVIQISSVGYDSREVVAQINEPLVISLQQKANVLVPVAVVINTGYQNISKEKMVGAFSQLDSAGFHRRAGMDIFTRLDGTVPGVLFNRNSSTVPVQVRGISTMGQASSLDAYSPLIILDNFPYNGSLDNINPNDIKDITVLKDAAAASIWGARAGNGVIVITTKKGSFNQPQRLSATSNITITQKPDLFYFPQMSSSDFIDVETWLYSQDFYGWMFDAGNRPVISPVIELLHKRDEGEISPEHAAAQLDAYRKQDLRKDMEKYVYRSAITQQYFLDYGGGSDKMSYSLSAGYDVARNNVQGTRPDKRITLNSQNTFRLARNIELNTGMQFAQSVNKSVAFGPGIMPGGGKTDMYPYAQLADAQGNPLALLKDYRSLYTDTAGNGKLLDWKYRPLDEIRLADRNSTIQFLRLNIGASWRFRDWLVTDIRYQYSSTNNENREYYSQETYFTRNLINRFTAIQGNTVTRNIPAGGILDKYNSRATTHNFRAQANIRKTFAGIHDLSVMIAGEIGESKSNFTRARLYGYQDQYGSWSNNTDYNKIFPSYGNIAGSFRIPFNSGEGNGTLNRFVSLLANASYTLLGKYTLYASGRRDGANVFGVRTNNKWKPLWSVGVNWDLSRESFFDVKWIESLKLRAAFGYMGNVSLGRSGLPSIRFTNSAPYTGLPAAIPGDAPNPDLRWEEVRTTNLGLDFALLKGRLSGTVEWYRKNSNYLISSTPIDPTSGVSRFVVNTASLAGKGWELSLNSVNTKGAIVWETRFALSYNKTIVKKFYNIAGNYSMANFQQPDVNPVEGRIAWGMASYRWAGLDPETGDPRGMLNKGISKDYLALQMDSVQNQVFHGSSIPLYFGFFTNSVTWKGFSLSTNILYKLDYYYRLPTISYSNLFYSWTNHPDYAKRWQKPGDEQRTTVPSMTYPEDYDRDNFYAYSEVNVKRADNIRLQDIRLSWLWQRKHNRFPVSRVQFYTYVNNLNIFLWKKDGGDPDPDMPANFFPLQRTYTLGATINF